MSQYTTSRSGSGRTVLMKVSDNRLLFGSLRAGVPSRLGLGMPINPGVRRHSLVEFRQLRARSPRANTVQIIPLDLATRSDFYRHSSFVWSIGRGIMNNKFLSVVAVAGTALWGSAANANLFIAASLNGGAFANIATSANNDFTNATLVRPG